MKASGTVVYLKQSFEVLEPRLSDMKGRGVVLRAGQGLAELFAEREPLYEAYADVTVELGSGTVEENIEKVMRALDAYKHENGGNRNG
jgi:shikimate kinase